MEEKKTQQEVIDLRLIAKRLVARKTVFLKTLPIVFVLSCVYILGVPRYYSTESKLAPELGSSMSGGTLGSIASAFGFDIGDMQTTDAINPLLYPDLMEDNGFVASLFDIRVKSKDGSINTTYYDYLKTRQKRNIWLVPFTWVRSKLQASEASGAGAQAFDPYALSKRDDEIAGSIRKNIKFSIDKKTGVITINTRAQDALICKTIADSVQERLQTFITDYRTSKARTDYDYYKELTREAKQDYERSRQRYANTSDANSRVALRSVELMMEDMENDMQLKFNTYTTLNTQLQAAKAKVQERTPVFTVIKGAAVPVKPAGPKRIIFVVAMLFLTSVGISLYSIRDIIFKD